MIITSIPVAISRLLKSALCLGLYLLAALPADAVVITIPTSPATDTTSFVPTNRRYAYSATRMIFTSAEIGATGTVTHLSFYKSSGAVSTSVNYIDILMRETISTTVTTAFPDTSSTSGYKRVYTSGPIDNGSSSGWTTVTLSTDPTKIFTYSGGTNNLDIIVIKTNYEAPTSSAGSYPIYTYTTTTGINSTAYYHGAGAIGSTFTAVSSKRPNIQLTIENTCAGKPAGGSVTGPATSVCPDVNFTLNGTGVTFGTGMHYQWQSRNAGSGAYANMTADDTFVNLTTKTLVNKDYRLVSTCTLSGQSDTSTPIRVNVLAVPVVSAATDTTVCIGGSVLLTTTSVSGATYTWFKDGVTTGITGTSYNATTSGVYTVRASTSSCSGTFSNGKKVTVNPLPTATISALSATTFCDGNNVMLQAVTATGMNYQWQRGTTDISGATSDGYSVTTSGSYRVKVTDASTSCFAYSSPISVTVNPTPAAFTISGAGGATSYCAAGSLTMSTTPVSGLSYQWEWSTGDIGGATSASYTATAPESYTLIAVLGSCSTKSNTIAVKQNPLPVATLSPSGPISFCSGDSLKIQATTASGQSYEWLESGTPIPGAPPLDYYWTKTAGKFSVKITITATGCSDISAPLDVSLISPTVPIVSADGPTHFCVGGDVTLNGTIDVGLSPQWQESGLDLAGETAISFTTSTAGTYRLKVTNGVGCAAYSEPVTVVVNPLPSASISVGGPLSICNGETATLTASIDPKHSYQWKESGTDLPGATRNPLYVTTAGDYSVQITDSNGCQATSGEVTIDVKMVTPFHITPHGNTYFCEGEKLMLSTQHGFTSYQWYHNGTYIPGATDTMVYVSKTGKYTVKVQDPVNSCFGTSAGYNILVIATPDSPVIVQSGMRLSAPGFSGVSYQWFRNGLPISGATDSFIFISRDGIYAVEVTNEQDCSNRGILNVTGTGIEDNTITADQIRVYPNPAQDHLNIEAPAGVTVTLTDIQGKTLFRQTDARSIDMAPMAAGMYLIIFTDKHNRTIGSEKISKSGY